MLNLKGKRAFIAGIGDDQGYGWAIAKALAEAGVEILIGTWTPIHGIFTSNLERGRFDTSRKLSDGSLMEIAKVYSLDAAFDNPDDVPEATKSHKRYANASCYTISEVADAVASDYGSIDFFIHSMANGPEVSKPLLETSRHGYLAALSASSYSFVSLLRAFGPLMRSGGATLSLTYIAAEKAIPGYGGGMSSAKAALESDTRTLAWEVGRKWGIRVNAISAGPLASRAAKAIGFIEQMIDYSEENAPLSRPLTSDDIGHTAAFLLSDLASAITGSIIHVDNGLHTMGVAVSAIHKD